MFPSKERHGPGTVPPKYSTTYEQTETSPCLSTRFPFILLISQSVEFLVVTTGKIFNIDSFSKILLLQIYA